MRYIVEYGVPGALAGANTVEDLRRYLDSDPHPDHHLANLSWLHSGQIMFVWETDEKLIKDRDTLLEACQRAYQKHVMDEDSIPWEKLSDELGGALNDVMGDKGFNDWVERLSPDRTV